MSEFPSNVGELIIMVIVVFFIALVIGFLVIDVIPLLITILTTTLGQLGVLIGLGVGLLLIILVLGAIGMILNKF